MPTHISHDSNAVEASARSESVHRSSRSASVRGPHSFRDSHGAGAAPMQSPSHGSVPEVFAADRQNWATLSPLTAALAYGHMGSYETETGQRVMEHFQQARHAPL